MIKKIVIITAVIILVSALGVGIYDAYQGNSTFEVPNVQAMAAGLGQEQGMGPGRGQGQMQGHAGQQGNGTGEPIQHDWLTLSGTVISQDQQGLWVDTEERGELLLNLGRPGFADEQNVQFNPGDTVTIQGFDSPQGNFAAGTITNETTGQSLMLRDPNGRPLWAGPGRNGNGGGQGQGQGRSGRAQGNGRGQGGGQGWN